MNPGTLSLGGANMALSPMDVPPFGVRERIWLARASGMDRLYVRNGIAAFSQELISVWRALQQESAFGCADGHGDE